MRNATVQQRYLLSLHLFDGLAPPAALCFLHTNTLLLAHFDGTSFSLELNSKLLNGRSVKKLTNIGLLGGRS